jgi:deoxycytidylate deaminase
MASLKAIIKNEKPAKNPAPDLFTNAATKELLESTHTAELVIALCGPIGSPLHDIAAKLSETLKDTFKYESCTEIRLSGFIERFAEQSSNTIPTQPAERRNRLIGLGDEMRKNHGHSVLAELAIRQIRTDREQTAKDNESGQYIPRRVCHIIDSIKNQQELDLLRTVYREALYVVGVFSPLNVREDTLRKAGLNNSEIADLMDKDSGEEIKEGQTVSETFPHCDFFLRIDQQTESQLTAKVERFLHLILGTEIVTPTSAEAAMYAAASAAGNSACLSRQVGAAVTDVNGEVLSVGWNDVPKAFGGLYSTGINPGNVGNNDMRCWNFGKKCYNDEEKGILANHVIDALGEIIPPEKRMEAIDSVIKNKKLRGLIEFSRSIHAEMHAILVALSSKGEKVKGGKLFVTTYPCHSCARHIIAAGISEVYYIEPYKKSLAIKLHGDAMTESEEMTNKVRLIPFDGVAPSKYLSLFRMKLDSRKKDGKLIKIRPEHGTPMQSKSLEALPALEAIVVKSINKKNVLSELQDGEKYEPG